MVIPAVYPLLRENFQLSFTQIGIITFVNKLAASFLQPIVGNYSDKNPQPFSLSVGMGFTLVGILCLAYSDSFAAILVSVTLVGVGSSIFHPESSRMARYASGGQAGMAQSIFQVGGNIGTAIAPLLVAAFIVRYGQHYIATFSILALTAIIILWKVGKWFKQRDFHKKKPFGLGMDNVIQVSKQKKILAIGVLLILIFSKFFYLTAMRTYLTFYLIDRFGISVQNSQIFLFVFLLAIAVGTIFGGPLGDKYGRKNVIWISILGTAPFALLLPHMPLVLTIVLTVVIGVILASAFPVIIVYAQELLPGKLGMVSGLFYGLAFGMGAVGAAALGILADSTSIYYMFQVCSVLPLLGLFAIFLPNIEYPGKAKNSAFFVGNR